VADEQGACAFQVMKDGNSVIHISAGRTFFCWKKGGTANAAPFVLL